MGWRQKQKGSTSEGWSKVNGVIISTQLNEQTSSDNDGFTRTTYEPVVDYVYQVNGQTYHGNKISAGWSMSYDYNSAQKKISPYKTDAPVVVYYNPANPAEAVLETKSSSGNIMLIIGIVLLALGLCVCCIVSGVSLMGMNLYNG
jgi:hypothetical protein